MVLMIISWIVFGGIAGWIASIIMGTNEQQGLFMNIVVGIVGAVIGGWIMSAIGVPGDYGWLGNMVVAILGSMLLLSIVGLVRKTA